MRSLHAFLLYSLFQFSCASELEDIARSNQNGRVSTSGSTPLSITSSSQSASFSSIYITEANKTMNCSASWTSWLDRSIDFSVGRYATFHSTRTYYNMTAEVTTLCDGHTRIVGGINGLTTTATGTTTFLTSGVATGTGDLPAPTPSCLPEPADRTGIFSAYYVWVPRTNPYNKSQQPSTLPYSVVDDGPMCGHCSIYGGTVQLLYFPVTSESSRNLCPTNTPGTPTLCPLASTFHSYHVTNPYQMSPCAYNTSNITSTTNSGPYIVSGGQTFYRNRAYISLQTAYAKNKCNFIGGHYPATLLTLMSSEVHSIGGYHHEFQDIGYSVNYADFTSVPAAAYYQSCNSESAAATMCVYSGSRYRYGTDFINGMSTVDFGNLYEIGSTRNQWIWDEAYAPTLLVPLQMRQMDPAWSTCSWNLNGLYDPPRLLTEKLTYPTPTEPGAIPNSATARPAGTPTNSGAVETGAPQATVPVPSPTPNSPIQPTAPADPASQDPASTTIDPSTRSFSDDPVGSSQDPADPVANSGTISTSGFLPPIVGTTQLTQQPEATLTFTASHQTHTIVAVPTATGVYTVDGTYTITAGAPAITVDGVRVSVVCSDVVVVGSQSLTLSENVSSASSETSSAGAITTNLPPIAPQPHTADAPVQTSTDVHTSGDVSLQSARYQSGWWIWFITLLASLSWL